MLSEKCNKDYTSLGVQGSQLVSGAVINLVFGIMMGIGVSEHTNYLYLYGYWVFVGSNWQQKTIRFILKLLVEIMLVIIPLGLLIIMAPILISNYYGQYVVSVVGMWLAAFSLTAFSNVLLLKFNII
jgi:hypothetical protein